MALRICVNYSLIFLALWAGFAWWLLMDQGWSASQLGTMGALGLGYLFGGLITAAIFAVQMIWESTRQERPVLRVRPRAQVIRLVPAMALRRVAARR